MDKKNLWQMLKYAIFSISAGVIQTGSFALLYNGLPLLYNKLGIGLPNISQLPDFLERVIVILQENWYSFSYIVSLALSVLWNFTLNRKYTFQAVVNVPIAMLKVAAFYVVFTPVSAWLGQIAETAGWNGNLVQILTMFANFVLEFAYFKFVVFKGKDEKTQK